jgi:hypothetical protein
MVDRVANADSDVVESLQLFPAVPEPQTALQPGGQTVK